MRHVETEADTHADASQFARRWAPDSRRPTPRNLSPEPHTGADPDLRRPQCRGRASQPAASCCPCCSTGCAAAAFPCGQPLVARYGRVKLAEAVAEQLHADLVIHLIGERPGGDAHASRSLSAYLVYRLRDPAVQAAAARFSGNDSIRFEFSVVSNIYVGGLPPLGGRRRAGRARRRNPFAPSGGKSAGVAAARVTERRDRLARGARTRDTRLTLVQPARTTLGQAVRESGKLREICGPYTVEFARMRNFPATARRLQSIGLTLLPEFCFRRLP